MLCCPGRPGPLSPPSRWLLLAALALAGCAPRPATPERLYKQSHALLVATTQYQAWPAQPGAQADLEKVAQSLVPQGFTVHKLLNPTLASLTGELKRFGTEYGQDPANRLLIYVAGYGITHVSAAGRAKGALALVDTPSSDSVTTGPLAPRPSGLVALADTPSDETTSGREWPRALSLQELDEWLKRLPVRHTLVVLNSCFNGSVFQGHGEFPDDMPEVILAPVRHTLIAGDAYQCEAAPGLFASTLAEALSSPRTDLDRDGMVSASEIAIRTRALVSERSLGQLTPRGGKSAEAPFALGEMVFGKPTAPKAATTASGNAP